MAQQPRDQRADSLSADMKALQERFDALTGRQGQSQQHLDQFQQKLVIQESRTNDLVSRVSDAGIFLTGLSVAIGVLGILIAVIVAAIGIVGYVQAVSKAKTEAKNWIENNSKKLREEIDTMEGEAAAIKARMKTLEQTVMDDAAKHTAGMDNSVRQFEALSSEMKDRLTGGVAMDKPLDDSERAELSQAENEVKDKPERLYTAQDWNTRAHAAYADKKLDEAALYFSKVAESPDAMTVQVAKALVNKGVVLGQMERSKDAVTVYDEVVARFGAARELALREQVAKALFNKGVALGQMGRSEEEVAVYDEVVARFGAASEPALRKPVAQALVNKGVRLGQMERSEEEVAVYDYVVARFGAAPELALREQVAQALFNKGVALGQMGRSEDAVTVYDEVVARFGAASELALREPVAKALVNKGGALVQMERPEEAVTVYDEVVARFGAASELALREPVAQALGSRGWSRYRMADDHAFGVDTALALERLPQSDWLLCNRAFALYLNGRSRDEVLAAYAQAWQAIKDPKRWDEAVLTDLRNHGHSVRPDAPPLPDDLVAAIAALAVKKE